MVYSRDSFIDPTTNHSFVQGQVVKRILLAKTLTLIAEEGVDVLYNGSLTDGFVKDIQDHGGIITAEDLRNYK